MPRQQLAVHQYIAKAAPKARPMLRQLRRTIRAAAPQATEKLSYGMPYYGYHGRLAYFAAFRDHVSYFVTGAMQRSTSPDVVRYRKTKATLHFPLGTKIPTRLITKLVKARMKENEKNRTK